MAKIKPLVAIDLDLYEAVFGALIGCHSGAVVSTRKAIVDARKRLPAASMVSDDELAALLVSVATVNGILVGIDHKSEAAKGPAVSIFHHLAGLCYWSFMSSPAPISALRSWPSGRRLCL